MELKKEEELVMKLLHFFITKYDYNPVVLHGAKNEIWLENLDKDYKIIRLVSNYIHNDEQFNLDLIKTRHISKSIKKKIMATTVPVLSIFVNLGENVNVTDHENIKCLAVNKVSDIVKNKEVKELFPEINSGLKFEEKGPYLFTKLSNEINQKAKVDSVKNEEIFKQKMPIVTYVLLGIYAVMFLGMYAFGNGSTDGETLLNFGANNRYAVLEFNQYFRLLTSSFLHIGIFHLIVNSYAMYIIGSQVENFYGKTKYIIIYVFSSIVGSLLSILFANSISAGASGAIFGLLGALLYFGYHYRLYLGTAIKNQIMPIIVLNLLLGFMISGVDNAAHIGGLIGGILISMVCGVKYKSKKNDIINGVILTVLFLGFVAYLLMQL